jgi:2-polyprenyl-6-methoxyphenol hydroxylase-like FAD-dependent oxidoreductase
LKVMTVLISGAGIAGPTLAFWLKAAGFEPTIVEHAPALRTGGYVIDFWGLGYDIAERMDLAGRVHEIGYHARELRVVDDRGRRRSGFGTRVFAELTGGRYVTLRRSDLSRLLLEQSDRQTELIFGDAIVALDDRSDGVQVQFSRAASRRFDLVVGADGLHSSVRRLAFGPQDQFEHQLGYAVAAFEARGYRPHDEDVYVMYGQPGRMLGRFALRDDRTLFLFVFATERGSLPERLDQQKALLRERYAEGKWECGRILDALDRTGELYLDRVSQIRMSTWSRGRVALAGDAAFCVSLLAGQGSALAMISAYVLAGELAAAAGGYEEAFRNYERRLRSFIEAKQRAAVRFAGAFAPKSPFGLRLRDLVINAFAIPGLARLVLGRGIADSLRLPEYRWSSLHGIARQAPPSR